MSAYRRALYFTRGDASSVSGYSKMMEFVDLRDQYRLYREDINSRIQSVLDHGRFIMGPEIAELEDVLAGHVRVKHCITVASGTAALEIALRALGAGPGDEVITVPS